MARSVKLPDELKGWKIISLVSEKKGNNIYRISQETSEGNKYANLYHIFAYGNDYSSDKAKFYEDEARFLGSIAKNREYFTCFGAYVTNNKAKSKVDMYIATEELPSLAQISRNKDFTDYEIAEFGLRMAEILAFLELKSIFHGDIRPENIYVTEKGTYKLGGFSDFESKISDFAFAAPEVVKDETPDFTTDIYSLGIIMYYLSNDKALPFEGNGIGREKAIEKRFESNSVTAPKKGNEKLKSVIVIACQPANKNRWKNANNMRNALQVVLDELEKPVEEVKEDNTVLTEQPENFDENVFEEFVYENKDVQSADTVANESDVATSDVELTKSAEDTIPNKTGANTADTSDDSFTEVYYEDNSSDENTVSADESNSVNKILVESDPLSEDVFDNYEIKKVEKHQGEISETDESSHEKKDYGIFFAEEGEESKNKTESKEPENIISEERSKPDQNESEEFYDYEEETHRHKKGSVVLIIVSVIVILAALGFVGYIVYNKTMTPDIPATTTEATTDQAVVTTEETTTEKMTTVPSTTQEITTQPETVEVPEVVGYGYAYAKEVLEEFGFVVKEGNYDYSDYYSEGYVTAQSLEPYTYKTKGSEIYLDISLGFKEVPTTETPTVEPQNNDFVFENSDVTYLSKSQLNSLGERDLLIALNEIYARRGRTFLDEELSEYFNSQKWYTPKFSPDEFNSNVQLNEFEEANIRLIVEVQKEKGYR